MAKKGYRFSPGDRVRIHATRTSSTNMKKHDGEIVTIKARSTLTWAYTLKELPGLWLDNCFQPLE